MANKIRLDKDYYDDDEEYEPSDPEDEYTEHEKKLLKKAFKKRGRNDDGKAEVMRYDDSPEEDDDYQDNDEDDDDMHSSDIDKGDYHDDNDIPDSKAWGKKRSQYYSTDFVDQDYTSYNEKEEELAHQEEEDAKEIQQRLAKQLDEADFTLDVYSNDIEEAQREKSIKEDILLKTDLSNVSKREKEQLFKKDSPEFFGLTQDFEQYFKESENVLMPLLEHAKEHNLKLPLIDFIRVRNDIILTYCSNISMYLLLKSRRIFVKYHPIVKRLVQLKQLLTQLNERYENVIKPEIEVLSELISSGQDVSSILQDNKRRSSDVQKKLKMLQQFNVDEAEFDGEDEEMNDTAIIEKSDEEASMQGGEDEFDDEDDAEGRRGITYQIAKNKGLIPHRNKDVRNPRVKHRKKYRKALIRRKGAVRTVRKEVKRYGGEISGIKATVKKSTKIKS